MGAAVEATSIVVTFDTFSDACGFEKMCALRDLPGRLIQLPASIRAECGTAFKAPADAEDAIMAAAEEEHAPWDELYEVDF